MQWKKYQWNYNEKVQWLTKNCANEGREQRFKECFGK
jgi:hypothetical protein